ncbi:lysophosphatidylserine lipase ABHD12 isoform X3 [Condylostylus longicornis]|uniref:lysophosphatidylserine lipase ABHD12 isoform X3 n=1 Tax=Condylostylus longicornis TaxID=2530218 RepID=UPI00244DF31B|nr:lysophosphatidylserine lipase ABHD12 isoform X3 [Condylostylus longicornis]
MIISRPRKLFKRISLITLKICLLFFVVVFVIGPIIFKHSVGLQRKIFFLTFVLQDCDFHNPSTYGLYATRNFYIKTKDSDVDDEVEEVKLGAWHLLPIQIAKKFSKELNLNNDAIKDILNSTEISDPELDKNEEKIHLEFSNGITKDNEQLFYEKMLKQPGIVIIYLHGNSGTRCKDHRIEMYHVFQKLGYHVIAIDYRGFGDSENISPSEEGCVKDAMNVYNYVSNITNNPIFIWAHSLGTGVSTHLLAQMNQMNIYGPKGLMLESPFTNIRDELKSYPMAFLFRFLPWFDYTIANPLYANSLRFESDQHINEFRQPVMILHAEDDYVVPFHLGYKLYRIALDLRGRSWGPIEFHRFDSSLKLGHKHICRASNLPDIIKTFIQNYKNEMY